MIIECSQCHSRYRFDESKLGQRPRARTRCAKCGGSIEIENPLLANFTLPPGMPGGPGAAPEPSGPPPGAEMPTQETRRSKALGGLQPGTAAPVAGSSTLAGQDLHHSGLLELPKDKRYSLAVIQGAATGQIFQITKTRTTLGRSGADIVLDDPEASRQHAVLEFVGDEAVLRDLGSTNGTFIEAARIEQQVLTNHMEFRIGSHSLMFIVTNLE